MALFLINAMIGYSNMATAAEPEAIKLRFSSSFMPTEPPNVQAMHALDVVEKRTDGRLKIERHAMAASCFWYRHELKFWREKR